MNFFKMLYSKEGAVMGRISGMPLAAICAAFLLSGCARGGEPARNGVSGHPVFKKDEKPIDLARFNQYDPQFGGGKRYHLWVNPDVKLAIDVSAKTRQEVRAHNSAIDKLVSEREDALDELFKMKMASIREMDGGKRREDDREAVLFKRIAELSA